MTENSLVSALQRWGSQRDDHVKAAVELLIGHDSWLRRQDFIDAAVVQTDDGPYIAWHKAREAYDRGDFARASTSERSILNLAIDLGEDRYRLTNLGAFNRKLVVQAITTATRVDGIHSTPFDPDRDFLGT